MKKLQKVGQIAQYSFSFCWRTDPLLLSTLIILRIVLCILPAALALVIRGLINNVVELSTKGSEASNELQFWVALGFSITLLSVCGFLLGRYITQILQQKLEHQLTLGTMSHATKLDLAHFEDPKFHDAFVKVRDNMGNHVMVFITTSLKVVTNGIQIVSLIAILYFIAPLLLWLMIPLSIPSLLFQMWLSKRRFQVEESYVRKKRLIRYYTSKLTNEQSIPEIRLLGLTPLFLNRVREILQDYHTKTQGIFLYGLAGTSLFGLLSVCIVYLIMYQISISVMSGTLTVGDIAIYGSAAAGLRNALENTTSSAGTLRWKTLYIGYLRQFFAIPIQEVSSETVTPKLFNGKLAIENLSFTYPETNKPVLDGISLAIKPGETVAIVGQNGAGKSTLVKLLTGLYKPSIGRILLDDININQLSKADLYKQLGVVFQGFGRYEATMAENIAFGNWQTLLNEQEQVAQIASHVGLQPLVDSLPHGYDTLLGRQFGEYNLSGGQWQQVAIARAYSSSASLFILDEPTSNLDARSEYRLFSQYKKLSHGRTTILISHRFSTVRMADRILVMEKGRIVENGHHDNLIAQKGRYAELYELHSRQLKEDHSKHRLLKDTYA